MLIYVLYCVLAALPFALPFSCSAVQVLVQKGADIHAVQSNGMASIHIAAQKGLIEVANILVQKQIDVINCKDEKAFTPLHYAGRHQRSKMVIFLLQK